MQKIGFRIPLLLSFGMYIASMVLPVYQGNSIQGYFAFLGGWMVGLNDIPSAVSWFGNVFYLFALILILKRKKPKPFRAFIFSLFAIGLGLAILVSGKAFVGKSETLSKLPMAIGFYVWMGSFILMALASWIKFKKS